MRKIIIHVVFIAAVAGLGILSGFMNLPGEWYQSLQKPFFNPPAWVFAPAWTTLYVLIGIAGARAWIRAPASAAMQIWFAQLLLNLLWSPAFFGYHSPLAGLFVIIPMLLAILSFIATVRHIDRAAAWLFVPYALWVSFATILNLAIYLLN